MKKSILTGSLFMFFLISQYLYPATYSAAQPANAGYYTATTKTTAVQFYKTAPGTVPQQTPANQSAGGYAAPATNTTQAAYAPTQLTMTPEQKDELRAEYMIKGDELFRAYKYDEAIRYYYAAVKVQDNYMRGWKQMAFCYYLLKKHQYAYSAFKKVLSFDPNDKDAKEFMDYYNSMITKGQKKPIKREMSDSSWRSAVLPGWGQIYNNQVLKGLLFGSGFLISAGLTVYDIVDERSKFDKYETANENLDIAYSAAQDAYNMALTFGIATALIWIGGMVDAALNYNCEEARSVDVTLKNNTIFLCETIRF